MNGAAVVTETLRRAGVTTIFSLSGNQIMPVYDACIDAGIRIVHTRHEAAAVYMAEAWAQVTGELGVALVTAAPGFANAISPLYTARMSESPVLFLSGDAPMGMDGLGPFQEMDQTAISAPVVKLALRPDAASLGDDLARAIRTALSGRPGPVHVALPFDVLNAEGGEPATDFAPEVTRLDNAATEAILARLADAKRPLIVTGPCLNDSRARGAGHNLASATGAPVIPIESPRGLRDPALGAFATVLAEADLIVSIGKVLDFAVGFARPPALAEGVPVIAVDPEAAALDRAEALCGERLVLRVQADPREAAAALNIAATPVARSEWTRRVNAALAHRDEDSDDGGKIHPRAVGEAVQRLLDEAAEPILICDGGEFGQWAQSVCTAKTRLTNCLSGAIGGGLCYALAAKLARPQATVIALMGDGTAGFHFAEFETAAREGAAFVAIIGNDSRWNAEHQIQLRDYGPQRMIGCELSPDARYDLAAAAFGCHAAHVTDSDGIEATLRDAITSNRPACLNIEIASLAAPKYTVFATHSVT